MKKLIALLILSVAAFSSFAQTLVNPAQILRADYQETNTVVSGWGDSLTEGAGGTPYTTYLQKISGFVIDNQGIGGQTSTQIRTRMIAATSKYQNAVIIWVGRNNYSDSTAVLSDVATMVAALGHKNYIVVSVLNGSFGGYEIPGGDGYNAIMAINNRLAAIYGSHYADVRQELINNYNPGLSQDVTDYNNNTPPTSLRSDAIHLNSAGYSIVANFFATKLKTIIGSKNVLIDNVLLKKSLTAPSIIGEITPNKGYFTDLSASGGVYFNNNTVSANSVTIGVSPATYGWAFANYGNPVTSNFLRAYAGGTELIRLSPVNPSFFTSPVGFGGVTNATESIQTGGNIVATGSIYGANLESSNYATSSNQVVNFAQANSRYLQLATDNTLANGKYIKLSHANQIDGSDGMIGAGLYTDGLNIRGIQTVAGGGRKIAMFGDMNMNGSGILGASGISGNQLISTIGPGTAPLVISSTTRVNNLNSQYISGQDTTNIALRNAVQTFSEKITFSKTITIPDAVSNTDGLNLQTANAKYVQLAANNVFAASGASIRFSHANQQNTQDGIICAGCVTAGLNIFGVQTTGGAGRKITMIGALDMNGNSISNIGGISANTLISTIATGTQPIFVSSSTMVSNLNANYIRGLDTNSLAQRNAVNTFTQQNTFSGQVAIGTTVNPSYALTTANIKVTAGIFADGAVTVGSLTIPSATLSTTNTQVWSIGSGGVLEKQNVTDLKNQSTANVTVSATLNGSSHHSATFDGSNYSQKSIKYDLTATTNNQGIDITSSNIKDGGLYILSFVNIPTAQNLIFASNFKQENGTTALGTQAIASTKYFMFYGDASGNLIRITL